MEFDHFSQIFAKAISSSDNIRIGIRDTKLTPATDWFVVILDTGEHYELSLKSGAYVGSIFLYNSLVDTCELGMEFYNLFLAAVIDSHKAGAVELVYY